MILWLALRLKIAHHLMPLFVPVPWSDLGSPQIVLFEPPINVLGVEGNRKLLGQQAANGWAIPFFLGDVQGPWGLGKGRPDRLLKGGG